MRRLSTYPLELDHSSFQHLTAEMFHQNSHKDTESYGRTCDLRNLADGLASEDLFPKPQPVNTPQSLEELKYVGPNDLFSPQQKPWPDAKGIISIFL